MTLRCTFGYNLGNQGWTEVWYASSDAPRSFALGLGNDANLLIDLRYRACTLEYIRCSISDLGVARKSFTLAVNAQGLDAGTVDDPGPDVTNVSALFSGYDNAITAKRHLWVSGLPDYYDKRFQQGASSLTPEIAKIRDAYIQYVSNHQLKIRYQVADNTTQPHPVTTVEAHPVVSGWSKVSVPQTADVPAAGAYIFFQRVPRDDLPGLGGIFQVKGTETAAFYIAYRYRAHDAVTAPSAMTWRNVKYAYIQPDRLFFERLSTHKRGRPIIRQVGRRPAGVKRQ